MPGSPPLEAVYLKKILLQNVHNDLKSCRFVQERTRTEVLSFHGHELEIQRDSIPFQSWGERKLFRLRGLFYVSLRD